jgi:hypothetical protein
MFYSSSKKLRAKTCKEEEIGLGDQKETEKGIDITLSKFRYYRIFIFSLFHYVYIIIFFGFLKKNI